MRTVGVKGSVLLGTWVHLMMPRHWWKPFQSSAESQGCSGMVSLVQECSTMCIQRSHAVDQACHCQACVWNVCRQRHWRRAKKVRNVPSGDANCCQRWSVLKEEVFAPDVAVIRRIPVGKSFQRTSCVSDECGAWRTFECQTV